MKADLHFHAGGFGNPADTKARIETVIRNAEEKDVGIVALTSCHEFETTLDCPTRFDYYIRQAGSLKKLGYQIGDVNLARGILVLERNGRKIYLLDGQEIKCREGDINIICPGEVLEYDAFKTSIVEVARRGRDLGAIVSLCYPFDRDGVARKDDSLMRALAEEEVIDYIETFDALASEKANNLASEWVEDFMCDYVVLHNGVLPKVKKLNVSDGHLDRDLAKAYTEFIFPQQYNSSEVFEVLKTRTFNLHPGKISLGSKAVYAYALGIAMLSDKTHIQLRKIRDGISRARNRFKYGKLE